MRIATRLLLVLVAVLCLYRGAQLGAASCPSCLLFDAFEYSATTCAEFQSSGPWKGPCKEQEPYNTIATVTTATGCSTAFPGGGSRVLKFSLLGSNGQADAYLSPTNTDSSANNGWLPDDVWFQFAICIPHSGTERTTTGLQKFIYPCNGMYPCTTHKWLFYLAGHRTYSPHFASPFGSPANGQAFLIQRDAGVGRVEYSPAIANGDEGDLGQQDIGRYLVPNVWNLVRMRFNTANPSSGQWHGWIRQMSEPSFRKVAEWIGGTTPQFTWTTSPGGHRGFRLLPQFSTDGWVYLDDFAVATSEGVLPQYGASSTPPPPPAAPSNLRIVS